MNDGVREFLREHTIHEVECVIADMICIARGKILPKDLFPGGESMRLPKSVLLNTVNGEQPDNVPYLGATDPEMVCVPDPATIRVVPWASESVALVIQDCQHFVGSRSSWGRARCCAACSACMRSAAGSRWWRRKWRFTWTPGMSIRTSRSCRRCAAAA